MIQEVGAIPGCVSPRPQPLKARSPTEEAPRALALLRNSPNSRTIRTTYVQSERLKQQNIFYTYAEDITKGFGE
ncbi:hypothetical protein NPIL_24851 [Nephila pilipes]|uniref:Uncharacterized protein n=1 Tax=Nephila pilipes TaxID=299642 RepID=A0A8X6P2T6_NEPPI|nr:hypothetical protein NPIL_24851 [Nephila pilipes]